MKRNLIANFHVVNNPAWFENTVVLLKSLYDMVDLAYFEKPGNLKKPAGKCHITFDDGDLSFYKIAYPILKKHGVPSSLFVSPKITTEHINFWFQEVHGYDKKVIKEMLSEELSLNLKDIENLSFNSIFKSCKLETINKIILAYQEKTNTVPKACQNINLEQVLEVEKSGLVTIGAHTMNHPILKNESDKISEFEITESVSQLEKLLGHEVRYFAYPNGKPYFDFSNREMEFLKKANISIAVSMEIKHVSAKDNLLALPRIGISAGSKRFLKLKLQLGSVLENVKSAIKTTEAKQRKKIASLKR